MNFLTHPVVFIQDLSVAGLADSKRMGRVMEWMEIGHIFRS